MYDEASSPTSSDVWKVWTRSPSRCLVRKTVPDYNFNFLGLPLEIKLLICRYVSTFDIKSLSQVSEDYKRFVDEYFVYDQINLPEDSQTAGDPKNRYVLSIYVNLMGKSPVKRAKSVEAVKLMNIAELKDVVLHSDGYHDNKTELPITKICPWFSEITISIFRNAVHIQSIDLILFKSQDSLTAMETLAKNANHLKDVTLRSSTSYYVSMWYLGEQKSVTLSRMIASLLAKSSITSLRLIDFHLQSRDFVWLAPDASNNIFFSWEGHFLSVKSKTLQNLMFTTSSWEAIAPVSGYIGDIDLICPQLRNLTVMYGISGRLCRYHLREVAPGLNDSLTNNCHKLRCFNGNFQENNKCTHVCPYVNRFSSFFKF